jgi:uncharacterized membrane protein YjjP (DUF1212 family)
MVSATHEKLPSKRGPMSVDAEPAALHDDPRFELVVGVAELELAGSGEGVFTIESTVRAVARAYGLEVGVFVLPAQLMLTVRDGPLHGTAVVSATPGISRLDRVDGLYRLLAEIQAGMPVAEAQRRLDELRTSPIPYPAWLRVIGVGMFAGGFAPSVVADGKEVGVSVVLALIMGVLLVLLEERRLGVLLPSLGAFMVAVVTFTVFDAHLQRSGPVLLMLPALFVVLPGDYLSGAVGELVIGHLVSGTARLTWALFILIQLLVGVLVAAQVTGFDISSLGEGSPVSTLPLWVVASGWIPFTIGLALTFNAPAAAIPWMTPLVVGTFLLQRGIDSFAGQLVSTVLASIALGAVGTLLSRAPKRPPRLLLFLGGFFVLTVGALGLRGLAALAGGHDDDGGRDLLNLLILVPSVSLGLSLGYLIVTRTRRHAGTNATEAAIV